MLLLITVFTITLAPVLVNGAFCVAPGITDGSFLSLETGGVVLQGELIGESNGIAVSCNEGFAVVDGESISTCSDGNLVPPIGKCANFNQVTCIVPNTGRGELLSTETGLRIEQGGVVDDGVMVVLACDEGVTANSENFVATCQNGVFAPTLAFCGSQQPLAPNVPTTPSTTPIPTCSVPSFNNGYYKNSDGATVFNGQIIQSGMIIIAACNTGFGISNANMDTRVCQRNGYFSGPEPQCLLRPSPSNVLTPPPRPPTTCNVPFIADGKYRTSDGLQLNSGQQVQSGTIVVAECNSGFEINDVPLATRTCQMSGFLTGMNPLCNRKQVPCRAPNVGGGKVVVVDNGREARQGAVIRDGKDVVIECDIGYVLASGASSSSCQSGTLRPALGTCNPVPTTQPPPTPSLTCNVPYIANGRYRISGGAQLVSGDKVQSGTNVVVECNTGYEIDEIPLASRLCGNTGTFIGLNPSCLQKTTTTPPILTCFIPYVADGKYRTSDGLQLTAGEEVQSGTEVVVECNAGFELNNADLSNRNCQTDGNFNGTIPFCTKSDIMDSSSPSHHNYNKNALAGFFIVFVVQLLLF